MTDANVLEVLFEKMVLEAEELLTPAEKVILRTSEKHDALAQLSWRAGHVFLSTLGLRDADGVEKWKAIEDYANQGILIPFNAEGAAGALLGYFWDKFNKMA
ncbi:hypothetical protein [Achromobacter sp. UMC71]|uniref:hypothetical protein n=1 Tax=Achromobacter sp. UMC71 TaxID=1862320 RepID=UPI001601B2B1|nr:hypothetical protein [Achromobacter sp. UMC71]